MLFQLHRLKLVFLDIDIDSTKFIIENSILIPFALPILKVKLLIEKMFFWTFAQSSILLLIAENQLFDWK